MTRERFKKLCTENVLLDGATGSNLMAAGMPRGICPESWVLEHPDVIQRLQTEYVDAGSQIIYAPTFGGNRINLTRHGLEGRIRELNLTLMGYAKRSARGQAFVAGDVTTTGQFMEPLGDLTYETVFDTYREQISLLAEGGADLIVVETMIHIGETCAALDAARDICDLPVMCSMTVEADGNIFTGGNIIEAASQLEAIIHNIRQAVSIPVLAKPNAGMPVIAADGQAIYNMGAETFARYMKILASQGATLLGGCCGTTPAFIRALAHALS